MWYDVGTWQGLCATRFLVQAQSPASDEGSASTDSVLALGLVFALSLPCLVFALPCLCLAVWVRVLYSAVRTNSSDRNQPTGLAKKAQPGSLARRRQPVLLVPAMEPQDGTQDGVRELPQTGTTCACPILALHFRAWCSILALDAVDISSGIDLTSSSSSSSSFTHSTMPFGRVIVPSHMPDARHGTDRCAAPAQAVRPSREPFRPQKALECGFAQTLLGSFFAQPR
ncbi:uncharacterized protein Triagg1_6801 [Trichoderma aggressivum f. europaeum]|uniref:Uncharacterized protein n=1 Tax=Trichoderma aggressivum f. europaeum TaxID=173218 RepID=A0AAE1M1D7_9HYPO|nr:hypothetical protein Triagg1_6801 [Trichoderma aggressivum f. europaeum]